MKEYKSIIESFSLVLLLGTFIPSAHALTIEITSTNTSQGQSLLDPSEQFTLEANVPKKVNVDSPFWITSPDAIPVMILPLSDQSSTLKLNAPKIPSTVKTFSEIQINSLLSKIMSEVSEIQALLRKGLISQSRAKIQNLMTTYPDVTFLKFLLANQYLLEGNRTEALKVAEEGLKDNPSYLEGQKFVSDLKGHKK